MGGGGSGGPAPANVTAVEQAAEAREQARIAARYAELKRIFGLHMGREGVSALYTILSDPKVSVDQPRAKLLAKLG